jgi:hypothetical protein
MMQRDEKGPMTDPLALAFVQGDWCCSCVDYHWDVNALEWERMGRDLRERAERWEHPAAEPETGEDVAALDELAEVFRAAMSAVPAEAPRRGAQ